MGARGLEAAVELAPGEARGAGASGPGEGPGPMTGGPGRALRVEGRGRDRAWGALRVEGGGHRAWGTRHGMGGGSRGDTCAVQHVW